MLQAAGYKLQAEAYDFKLVANSFYLTFPCMTETTIVAFSS
jgi:hypothetical protein